MSSTFELTVKSPDRQTYTVRVSPEWTIERVKREVAEVSQTPNLDIVFCGQRLENHKKLKEVGMQTTSTVHFVVPKGGIRPNIRPSTNLQSLPLASLPQSLSEQGSPGEGPGVLTHQFFVYCRKPCAALAPGKLRVRCATCKEGGFELQKDPAGWADVLEKGRINGICHTHGCRGDVAEFYYKCANHETAQDDTCPPLPMFRQNTYNIICPICTEMNPLMVVFECPDHHCMCLNCFTTYCTTKLKDRQFVENDKVGFTLSCPVPNHDQYVVTDIHHFRIMGDKLYDRYKDLGTEMFLLQNGGVFCPSCNEGILPDQRRVECRCGRVFCKNCRNNFHPGKCSDRPPSAVAAAEPGGARLPVDTQAFRQARWNEASENYIRENAKLCPKCRANTEKNGGCNHITCTMCKHEWCWLCGKEWGRSCMNSHWFQE